MCPPNHGKPWTKEVEPLGSILLFLKKGEDVKGTLGILVTTILDRLLVFEGAEGLANKAPRHTRVDELKFKDNTSAVDTFVHGALTADGETPLATMAEVGVDIAPKPSPKLDMKRIKGIPF